MLSTRTSFYLLGAATPFLMKQLRPLAKMVIKGGIVAGNQCQKLVAEARESIEDVAAEASAELASKSNGAKEEDAG